MANRIFKVMALAAVVILLGVIPAQAMTLDLNYEFSGGDEPVGTAPWLTATFIDLGLGTVQLTLDASGLTADEFVGGAQVKEKQGEIEKKFLNSGWYFNFDPLKDLNKLVFTPISGNTADLISAGTNAFKADGDGSYDIVFSWDKNYDDGALIAGQTAVYEITYTGDTTFNPLWFDFLSQPPTGGAGPFQTAAQVQGIDIGDPEQEGSGWIAPSPVPEPGTMLLLGTGLVGLAGLGRKKVFNN